MDGVDLKDGKKQYGSGIDCSNIVGFAVALANVTDADQSNAQTNAAFLVAGDDLCAKFENEAQVQDNDYDGLRCKK